MGFVLAWAHRRALAAVLAPVLVPAVLLAIVLRLFAVGDDLTIVNGTLLLQARSGPLAWLELAVTCGVVMR